jgi:hypothetical protein
VTASRHNSHHHVLLSDLHSIIVYEIASGGFSAARVIPSSILLDNLYYGSEDLGTIHPKEFRSKSGMQRLESQASHLFFFCAEGNTVLTLSRGLGYEVGPRGIATWTAKEEGREGRGKKGNERRTSNEGQRRLLCVPTSAT